MTRGGAGSSVRSVAIEGVAGVLYRTKMLRAANRVLNRWSNARGRGAAVLQILMYHRVSDRRDPFLPAMTARVFRTHMETLRSEFTVVSLREGVEGLRAGELAQNAVAITFDDGYRDNCTDALPVLRELGLPATVFIATGVIGNGGMLWHDRMFRAFSITPRTAIDDPARHGETLRWQDPASRDRARDHVLAFLKSKRPDERDGCIVELLDRLAVDDVREAAGLMMDWHEVERLRDHGIEIGAHTVTHPILSRIPREDARSEIRSSKAEIEARLGTDVRFFAYPNGGRDDFDERTCDDLRAAGFEAAVTTEFGTNRASGDVSPDLMRLRRSGPYASTPGMFTLRMNHHRFAL